MQVARPGAWWEPCSFPSDIPAHGSLSTLRMIKGKASGPWLVPRRWHPVDVIGADFVLCKAVSWCLCQLCDSSKAGRNPSPGRLLSVRVSQRSGFCLLELLRSKMCWEELWAGLPKSLPKQSAALHENHLKCRFHLLCVLAGHAPHTYRWKSFLCASSRLRGPVFCVVCCLTY